MSWEFRFGGGPRASQACAILKLRRRERQTPFWKTDAASRHFKKGSAWGKWELEKQQQTKDKANIKPRERQSDDWQVSWMHELCATVLPQINNRIPFFHKITPTHTKNLDSWKQRKYPRNVVCVLNFGLNNGSLDPDQRLRPLHWVEWILLVCHCALKL